MTPPVLQMSGIHKSFPGVRALEDVRFDLRAGEVHVLLGENGAGKSTLMKILSGAYRLDSGEILIDGQPVVIGSPRDAQALGISTIYQELNLIPQLSAGENIFLGREPASRLGVIDRSRVRARATELLAGLGMSIDPRTPVRALGLAQQQMVEVAKALNAEARILIMDEPSSALTSTEVRQLFAVIEALIARGVAVVYISHRMEEVFRIGHRVTVLRDGRNVDTVPIAGTTVDRLVRLMANRDITEHFPKERHEPGAEVLRVEHLTRRGILHDVSFSLRAGEVLGVAGLLGAGRTELARAVFGADPVDSGRVIVRGTPVHFRSPAQAIGRRIGLLPEDRKTQGLVQRLSIRHNVALPHLRQVTHLGVVGRSGETGMAHRAISDLRIKTPGPEQQTMFLSGGNQQKVVLGKWLAGGADILIFDEPTRGIDVAAKVEIYHLMNRLTAAGAAILMISSELPEILGMSDRILVMHQGRVSAELDARAATQETVLNAALGLQVAGNTAT